MIGVGVFSQVLTSHLGSNWGEGSWGQPPVFISGGQVAGSDQAARGSLTCGKSTGMFSATLR